MGSEPWKTSQPKFRGGPDPWAPTGSAPMVVVVIKWLVVWGPRGRQSGRVCDLQCEGDGGETPLRRVQLHCNRHGYESDTFLWWRLGLSGLSRHLWPIIDPSWTRLVWALSASVTHHWLGWSGLSRRLTHHRLGWSGHLWPIIDPSSTRLVWVLSASATRYCRWISAPSHNCKLATLC